jgi:hypothetical protein
MRLAMVSIFSNSGISSGRAARIAPCRLDDLDDLGGQILGAFGALGPVLAEIASAPCSAT